MIFFRNPQASANGFTLLEVMVAMTIVGLGIVTLLEIFSLGLRLGTGSTVRTDAVAQGRQIMDDFLLRRPLREGTEEGRLDEKSRWQARVQGMRDSTSTLRLSSPWTLMEVSLDMRVNDAGRERHVEFKTLRLVKTKNP